MPNSDKIIYSINIDDVQNVANQELFRKLSMEELRIVEEKLGDYIDWYGSIALAIDDMLNDDEGIKHITDREEDAFGS